MNYFSDYAIYKKCNGGIMSSVWSAVIPYSSKYPFNQLRIKPFLVEGNKAYFKLNEKYALELWKKKDNSFMLSLYQISGIREQINAIPSISKGFGIPNKEFSNLNDAEKFIKLYLHQYHEQSQRIKKGV